MIMKVKAVRKDDAINFRYGNSMNRESIGISTSSAMISVVQMRSDQLQKKFQEHQRHISSDRMVSTEKGVNEGDRNIMRGKLYDKYMEKRVARLRMEQGSKRAAMNEATLRALRNDLERCRMELQGIVVSSRDVGLGGQQRTKKFQSINVWSSQMDEELRQIDIVLPEEDDDVTKFFSQKEETESRASARDELLPISRSQKPRKDSLVWKRPSSSLAQPIALPVPRPSNTLMRSISSRKMSKQEYLFQLRKENAKHPMFISRKTNHSIAGRNFQTRNVSEDLQKSWSSLKKSSTNSLGYRKSKKGKVKELKGSQSYERYWMSFKPKDLRSKAEPRTIAIEQRNNNSHGNLSFHADSVESKAKAEVPVMRLDEEESNRDLKNFSKRVVLENFTKKADAVNSGKTTSSKVEKEQEFCNLTVRMDSGGYSGNICSYVMRNVENIGIANSTVANEGPKDSAIEKTREDCFIVNVVNPGSSQESDDSGNFESTDDDSSRSLSCVDLPFNSASELPNSTLVKNFEVFGTKRLNGIPTISETTPAAGHVRSPEADTNRNPPKSIHQASNCSFGRSPMGISKGYKRFPKGDKNGIQGRSFFDFAATRSFLLLSSLRCRREDTNPRQPIPREQIPR